MNRSRKGQSLIETMLILAAFVALLLGIVDIGQMLFIRQSLAERTRNAVRWAAVHPYDAGVIRNLVRYGTTAPAADAAALSSLKDSDVHVANPGCPGADCRITITVVGHGIRVTEPVSPIPETTRRVE